ncbi:uncharacterized protein TNCT_227221 [Trichonephila clavata]|uniref:Uncharacterized protein n=1 Tax=Trichonephila clavata TaxID=2740835 RepID=A0A8X6LNM9_TRICU|nr:uncharacterized protein TNCT_227221 [Trichonephila clavata]
MSINFWPSLQFIAYARIAQGILYTFDLEVLKRRFLLGGLYYTQCMERIEKMVSVVLLPVYPRTVSCLSVERTKFVGVKYLPLPNEIQKKLVGVVMALAMEIKTWFDCHKYIVRDDNLDLRNKVNWFSFGIIDRLQTARIFIQDENLNIRERFHLACTYYFEDYVQMLWRNMSRADRFYARRRLPRSRGLELWLRTLHRKIPLNWEEISRNEMRHFFRSNTLGMRRYFRNLRGAEMRYQCIHFALDSGNVHHFDLYLCLRLINTGELNAMFTRLQTTEFWELFQCFLQWPFQTIFLDIVNDFQRYINEDLFHALVTLILKYKLPMEWQEYPYVNLFQCFWNLLSTKFEDYVINDKELYVLVEYVLNSSNDFDITEYLNLINE